MLDKAVILIALKKENDANPIPFDVAGYSTILYQDSDISTGKLRADLFRAMNSFEF